MQVRDDKHAYLVRQKEHPRNASVSGLGLGGLGWRLGWGLGGSELSERDRTVVIHNIMRYLGICKAFWCALIFSSLRKCIAEQADLRRYSESNISEYSDLISMNKVLNRNLLLHIVTLRFFLGKNCFLPTYMLDFNSWDLKLKNYLKIEKYQTMTYYFSKKAELQKKFYSGVTFPLNLQKCFGFFLVICLTPNCEYRTLFSM